MSPAGRKAEGGHALSGSNFIRELKLHLMQRLRGGIPMFVRMPSANANSALAIQGGRSPDQVVDEEHGGGKSRD